MTTLWTLILLQTLFRESPHLRAFGKLKVLYYNARSIIPKLDELRILAPLHNPDIICIVESWLDETILDCELTILNYNFVHLDRNRHGDGVLLYIRDT